MTLIERTGRGCLSVTLLHLDGLLAQVLPRALAIRFEAEESHGVGPRP